MAGCPRNVLPELELLNHLGAGQGSAERASWEAWVRREGAWGAGGGVRRGGKLDKRDQLLFAHKPQVDNEWRGWCKWELALAGSLCQLKSLPRITVPLLRCPNPGPPCLHPAVHLPLGLRPGRAERA